MWNYDWSSNFLWLCSENDWGRLNKYDKQLCSLEEEIGFPLKTTNTTQTSSLQVNTIVITLRLVFLLDIKTNDIMHKSELVQATHRASQKHSFCIVLSFTDYTNDCHFWVRNNGSVDNEGRHLLLALLWKCECVSMCMCQCRQGECVSCPVDIPGPPLTGGGKQQEFPKEGWSCGSGGGTDGRQ